MNFSNKYDGIDKYAIWLIKYKAGKLVKQPGFTESDRKDLEQEMAFDLLCRLPKFDPSCTKKITFITNVINYKAFKIVEAKKAGIRDYSLCAYSLNECVEDKDGNQIEHIDTINQDEYFSNTGGYQHSMEELVELAIDIKEIIASLPPKYRSLCEHLKEENVAEISRNMNISRETIYKYIRELREVFENTGFKNYF